MARVNTFRFPQPSVSSPIAEGKMRSLTILNHSEADEKKMPLPLRRKLITRKLLPARSTAKLSGSMMGTVKFHKDLDRFALEEWTVGPWPPETSGANED